jgi:LSD1 subclass zinc finger protein
MGRPRTTPRGSSARYVRCTLCDTTVTLNNLSTHLRGKHPDRPAELARSAFFAELEQPLARVAPAPSPLPPLTADEIVQTVVEQLAMPSGLLPVAHLAAVLAWRDATAAFLRAVTPTT